MPQFHLALSQALKRRRNPWNWCVQLLGIALLSLALWFKNGSLFGIGMIALSASLFELHLSELHSRRISRAMRAEQAWIDKPWTTRKRLEVLLIALLLAGVLWSLATRDIAILLLVIGVVTLAGVGAAQAAVKLDD